MKRLTLFTLAGVFAAVVLAAATAAGNGNDQTRIDGDSTVAVYVAGCDGLIADSGMFKGYLPDAHFLVASIHSNGWSRRPPDVPWEGHVAQWQASGSSTDTAGHTFTVHGRLSYGGAGGIDFLADDGDVMVRRDDGALARGTAWEGFPQVLGIAYNVIYVKADLCHLR